MPIDISITEPPYSAAIDGRSDDSDAWQRAFDDLGANDGGRLLFDSRKTGARLKESIVRRTITIPRMGPTTFEGRGLAVSRIKGIGVNADPIFEWDSDSNGNVEGFVWQNMTLRRSDSGGVIRHSKPDDGRFLNCHLRNLRLMQGSNGRAVTLDIEGNLHSKFEGIHLSGGSKGGTGFRLRGSHAYLDKIYVAAANKNAMPSMFLDFRSSNSRITHVRVEGGNEIVAAGDDRPSADYWIHDCSTVDAQDLHSEGHLSKNIVLVENCLGVRLQACGIATQPKGHVAEPMGIRFIRSSYCAVVGGHVATRYDPGGRAIWFDRDSKFNSLHQLRIVNANFRGAGERNQILDEGTGNRWTIVDRDRDIQNGTHFVVAE